MEPSLQGTDREWGGRHRAGGWTLSDAVGVARSSTKNERTRQHASVPVASGRPGGAPRSRGEAPALAIPNIELHSQLGRGGMAVVWDASDHGFTPARRVAVKFMDEELSADAEFRARFEREASIVAGFRHESIVRIYSSGEANAVKYIVMEYLGGGTLADRVKHGPIRSAEALRIATELADALAYSHDYGIIHRDFKPANVLFTAEDRAVLSDFGVAKVLTAEQAMRTRYHAVVGAPRYMAPEQAVGNDNLSDRADIYSFGVTLFEMLTGKLPPTSLQSRDGLARIRSFLPDQSATIRELIYDCLSPDVETRPTAEACRRILADVSGNTRHASRLKRSSRKPRRLMTYVARGAVILAVSGAVVYVAATVGRPPPASETPVAIAPDTPPQPSP